MSVSKNIFLTKVIAICLLISFALPTQAASITELSLKVQALQKMLAEYQTLLLGSVSSAPLTAGVGTVLTVANDQELFNALSAVTGGEIIKLNPGTYSPVTIDPGFWKLSVGALIKTDFAKNLSSLTAPVTITSADLNNRATMTTLRFNNGANSFRVENISFRPKTGSTAVDLTGNNLTFYRNDISYGDSTNWTATDWNAKTGYAISANGTGIEISYNYLKNVNFGIVGGDNSYVHHNKIENFIGDGLRGGDNSRFEHNIVMNPYSVNDNHTDGFQSFAAPDESSSVKNVTLRYNTFLALPSTNPLRGNMQGIGLFDGFYDNWIIENNLLLVNPWHGIGLMGARTASVQNNVAIAPTKIASEAGTWIQIFNSKKGVPSTGVTYKNNYANTIASNNASMVSYSDNVKVAFSEYANYFTNPSAGDFTFKQESLPFPVGAVIDVNKLAPEPYVSGGVVTTPSSPIVTFAATPTSIETGNTTTLTWSSTNANSCVASGDWSGAKAISGSETTAVITTSGTKTYTLVCTGAGGTKTKSVTLTVTTPTVVTTPTPTATLTTSASSVATGGTATLTWSSINANSCVASGDWSGAKTTSGTQSTGVLSTVGTKTYTLVCTGTSGTVTKSVTIAVATTPIVSAFKIGDRISVTKNVNVRTSGLIDIATLIGVNPLGSVGTLTAGPTVSTDRFGTITWFNVNFDTGFDGWVGADNYALIAPTLTVPVVTLTTSASSVATGDTATLTWSSINATACTASGDWSGAKTTSGTQSTGVLSTVGTKTYTLSCTGAGGTTAKSVTVAVTTVVATPLPVVTLTVSPTAIDTGTGATLTWSSTNATACTASGSWTGAKATAGSLATGNLSTSGTRTYTLSCTGTGGTTADSATLSVTDGDISPIEPTTDIRVSALNNLNVRSTPNGAKIGIQYLGAKGTQGTQAPVVASGYTWVYVDFDSGVDGYVAKEYLTTITATTPVTLTDMQAQIAMLMQQVLLLQDLLAKLLAK